MDRIIIAISNLNKESWVAIYKFIKSIVDEGITLETKNEAFNSLRRISIGIRQNSNVNSTTANDVYSLYGEELSDNNLYKLNKDTCFSILYQKNNASDDFTELVPFILLQHEFGNAISLGIDVGNLDLEDQKRYKFKCSDFFILQDIRKPRMGNRSLYFVNEMKVNKDTGEILRLQISSFAGKSDKGETTYIGKSSRRFLPLLKITEKNYKTIFGVNSISTSKEAAFVKESIEKIRSEWENKKSHKRIWPNLQSIFDPSEPYFAQWFESGYFLSYEDELKLIKEDEILGIRNTLDVYKNSILELVQNVIFHGGKEGMIYCVFDKKTNMSNSYGEIIPNFNSYKDNTRFLRLGIYDFGKNGIVDTFNNDYKKEYIRPNKKSNQHVRLTDFFDIYSIVTTGLTCLDMRYAARLGIKTFVKNIVDHMGYFYVESCEHNDGRRIKKTLQTKTLISNSYLCEEKEIDFVDGTHYEIILPVVAQNYESSSIPIQTTSVSKEFSKLLDKGYPLQTVYLPMSSMEGISNSKDKEDQVERIEKVCKEIISQTDVNKEEIAIDLDDNNVSPVTIFKIASFLQLTAKNRLDKIILVNVTNRFSKEFCSIIDTILIRQGNDNIPVWSRNCAIVILDENLHVRIVWGKTKDELYYINNEFRKMYYNYFLDSKEEENPFGVSFRNIDGCRKDAEKFILPYDVLVKTKEKNGIKSTSPFENLLLQILKRKIISSKSGMSVNHQYTYIGRKVIIRNYYEADTLFQNNFFVERFAYLITINIRKEYLVKNSERKKKLVLIGYKYYSEFLLKTIKRLLKTDSVSLVIFDEGKNNDGIFNFNIDNDGDKTKKEIISSPDTFLFATIVPIGATLSTNDKIISFFKRWLEKEGKINSEPCFYNHCAIVVRDKVGSDVTPLESEQKWDKTNISDHSILTRYKNAKKVYYTIQIANREETYSSEGNWIKRLNDSISFPKDWSKEKYVNLTENSSINSQNLMDYPMIISSTNEAEELEHIYNLKDYIFKGHIEIMNCHHKYYIDTESFVRREWGIIKAWLEIQKANVQEDQKSLNVLITPNLERESNFVSMVNNYVFDGNALIIYLDVSNWRSNIVNKLSFLKYIQNVKYHYVDQAFLTGETFFKSKVFVFSIVGRKVCFSSAFTVVNRLPYLKEKEIREELDKNFFSYATLHYPTSKAEGQECELCKLVKYYEELGKKTVLESCTQVIRKNKNKIELTNNILKKGVKEIIDEKHNRWKKRIFLRLIITHWLYYRISEVSNNINIFEIKKDNVKKELDYIYLSLCDELEQNDCLLNQKIGQWFKSGEDLFSQSRELTIDKKISFYKVISSPPLSQYIAIREYAHDKLLEELNKVINKKGQLVDDDLKIVKSIIKSLSFLKSNALVRKDVIVGIWRVLKNVLNGLDEEKKHNVIRDFSKDVQFFIKNAFVEDEAKATFLGEMLRRGKEIDSFDKIEISQTFLSLSNNKKNDIKSKNNDLFCMFNDCEDEFFKREYISFLVWLFYDNTTIIRNTLTNFSKELEKDRIVNEIFYDDIKLKCFVDFRENFEEKKRLFETKVQEEYYYSSFLPYLNNGDGIDFIEKMLYVTYAKFKLKDLTTNKHKTMIETDTRDLMEIFSAIMGADAAFWTMKKDNNLYPISTFGKLGNSERGWDYYEWFLKNNYYTSKVFTYEEVKSPLIPIYNISKKYGEYKDLKMCRLGVLVIGSSKIDKQEEINVFTGNGEKHVVSTITFLYSNENKLFKNESDFRIKVQEYGRLLLLLKNEINKYVLNYLIEDKILDLWVAKYKSIQNFEKIYANSSHIFNSVYEEMDEFDSLEDEALNKLSRTWFFLTNEIISFLYSDIARNADENVERHYLNLDPYYIIDKNNSLGDIFNHNFVKLLSELLNSRWKSEGGKNKNSIYINNVKINEFKISNSLGIKPIQCRKHIMRTFITQCLHNSLSPLGKGHRKPYEVKRVDIIISETSITIEDHRIGKYNTENDNEQKEKFGKKKDFIKNMKCDDYSSTTLTSLQGFVQYMREYGIDFSCDYGFNKNNNFIVTINF
jgi:hypothetical protein